VSRREYSNEEKAAVLAALLEGQAISYVAKEYKIPEGTIKAWRSRIASETSAVATERKQRIGDLLIEYLEANLTTLRIQQEGVFRNESWLLNQEAAQLATLHGVATDKAVRLLEALGSAADEEEGA
jgi:transposase-like protein